MAERGALLQEFVVMCVYCWCVDLDEVSEDKVKELCTGGHVFFNCMGTSRAIAGSKVSEHGVL